MQGSSVPTCNAPFCCSGIVKGGLCALAVRQNRAISARHIVMVKRVFRDNTLLLLLISPLAGTVNSAKLLAMLERTALSNAPFRLLTTKLRTTPGRRSRETCSCCTPASRVSSFARSYPESRLCDVETGGRARMRETVFVVLLDLVSKVEGLTQCDSSSLGIAGTRQGN